MFDKCITCERLGQDCMPNILSLNFPSLLEWWKKRQNHLGWSNQVLSEKSTIPIGTITRIKSGEDDCRYSTMQHIIHALMGNYAVEFPCQKKLDQEFSAIETLKAQKDYLVCRNEELLAKLESIDEQHRNDIRIIKAEYQEEITFLKEQLRAWQRGHSQ